MVFLVHTARLERDTKVMKIIQDLKGNVDGRMEPLENLIISTTGYIHIVVEPNVFIAMCRGFWDRMVQVKL